MSKEIFLECSCYSEGIKFDYNKEDNTLEISIYQRGLTPRTKSWKEKLRWIWQIITKDTIYGDEIMLEQKNINRLTEFVNQNFSNNSIFANEKTPNKELKVGGLYIVKGESLPFRYIKYSNQDKNVFYFKHHQLKTIIVADLKDVIREANEDEIYLYNMLKEKMNDVAKRIY